VSDKPNEIHDHNFSHSEKAELYPEFMVFDMGPSGMLVSGALDAPGCAAAGQKLTLDKGLGADFALFPAQEKGQRLLPALQNHERNCLSVAQHALTRLGILSFFQA
jgi:hypothetical protein